MFSHVTIGSNDIEKSRAFYDATLGVFGIPPGKIDPKGRLAYVHDGGRLMITPPIDGKPTSIANGSTIGFVAPGTAEADAWHKAGVAHGGTAVEDPPGMRQGVAGPIYLAYLRDPDGTKLCAIHRPKS